MASLQAYQERLAAFWKKCPKGQEIAALRELCRTDLYFLLRYGLNRSDVEKEWLFQRCLEVQDDPNDHLDLWAREHYKSTIITYAKTIQDVLCSHGDEPKIDREGTYGIFSHTRPIAKGFLRQIKYEFETNEKLKEWFPDILYANPKKESPKWSEDEGICVKRKGNPKESTIEAHGLVDGQPTSKHFVGLIYDDVVTRESVTTPEMMQKTTASLELSYNLGADGGFRRFIGTRYHFNDSYKTIIDRGTAKPRVYAATDNGTVSGIPVLIPKDTLDAKRRDMGSYTFACQMLQNPVADEAQGFKSENIRYYDDLILSGLNLYIVLDAASSKKKGSDYTAAWVLGLGPDGNIYVVDMVRDRLNLTQRATLVMDWHRKYQPLEVRYEKYGLMSDIEHIQTIQAKENYRFDIVEVGGQTAKEDRIRRLIPTTENHMLYLPRSCHKTNYEGKTIDLVNAFIEEELKAFPVSMHDDMLDSLARIHEPKLELAWPKEKAKTTKRKRAGAGGWQR